MNFKLHLSRVGKQKFEAFRCSMRKNEIENNGLSLGRKLLIIGNGFDSAHSLPTSYNDFKKYMSDTIREYQGKEKSEELIELKEVPRAGMPKIHINNEIIDDYGNESKIIYWLMDEIAKKKRDIKWGKFEDYLGQLNISKILRKWGSDDFEVNYLREVIDDISGFFFEWINTINLDSVQKKKPYLSIIDKKSDIAISFNYTETLETIYGVKASNICYIHGQRETNPELRRQKSMLAIGKNSSKLVVGFGSKHIKNKKLINKKILLMGLYKDTEDIIRKHKYFFDRVASLEIKEIYSLGFSFSDVDMPYIKKICDELKRENNVKKMTWFINPYGRNKRKEICEELHMRKCIWKAGFRGKVRKI